MKEIESLRFELNLAREALAQRERHTDARRHEMTLLRDENQMLRAKLAATELALLRATVSPATEEALGKLRRAGLL